MNRTKHSPLAALAKDRLVERLPNGNIEVTWDQIVLHLRLKDLLVLQIALHEWGEDPTREWAQSYCLRLNESAMILAYDDLIAFCTLIDNACRQLARCPVHWADLRVEVAPCVGSDWLASYRLN